jgi:hypothetical protein
VVTMVFSGAEQEICPVFSRSVTPELKNGGGKREGVVR